MVLYTRQKERETKRSADGRAKKISKKFQKPLDKQLNMCYNKYIRNGDELQKKKLEGRNLIARKRSKMTNREFLNAVINANLSYEITARAQGMLQQMDARNAKRASTPSKTAVANAPLKTKIVELISEKSMTAPEVSVALEITTQKASALLRQLCEDGVLTSEEIKVPKKGKIKSYSLVEGAQYLPHEVEA